MLDVINSSYHLLILIILAIYLYLIKYRNKQIILSHLKKTKISLLVLIFSSVTVWITSLLNYGLTNQIQKIMTTFFVVVFALIWLASDNLIQFARKKKL